MTRRSTFLSLTLWDRVLRNCISVAILTLLFGCLGVNAQTGPTDGMTPSGLSPGAPSGTYSLSGFENVNLYNGNLNFAMPLLGIGGRGGAHAQLTLNLDSGHWTVEKDPEFAVYYPQPNWWEGIRPGYGPGVLQARNAMVQAAMNSNSRQTLTRLTFTAPDGTEYQLVDTYHGGQQYFNACDPSLRSRGQTFISHEGTAFITFVSNTTIYDQCTESTYSDGISGYLYFPDGARYEIGNGVVTKIRDRNGNVVSFAYDSFKRVTSLTDSINRQVTIAYADMVSIFYDQISYRGFGGATRTIKVWHSSLSQALRAGYTTQTYAQLFPNLNGGDGTVYNPTNVVSAVELPDGRRYQFFYDPYKEMARVVLPTGGAIEYDYVEMGDSTRIQRRVSQRRVYADGTNLESKQVFTATYNGSSTTTIVEERDSNYLLSKSQHYFYGDPLVSVQNPAAFGYSNWQEGREFKTESLASDGMTVLRRSENTWEQGAIVSSWLVSVNAANNPRVNQTLTTLVDTNQIAMQTYTHDQYNNTTDVYEYDFGAAATGGLLRRRHTDFMAVNPVNGVNYASSSNNFYFFRVPSQSSTYDAGNIERARTIYEYDNYGADSNHAGLFDRPGISGFDSGFTTSYRTRGNATAVTRYLLVNGSVVGSVSSYSQYDIAGNVVKTIDPRGYATSFFYADCFGAPDGNAHSNTQPTELSAPGQSSYALLTSVTNPLGQTAYAQYDYYLGRAVDGEDINGVVASGYFSDVLDRPTQVIRDFNNLAAKSQINFTYDDVNHIVTTNSDFSGLNDNLLRKDSLYDGLGRTIETRAYENATQYITVKQVPFVVLQDPDTLGFVAASQSSNPYRSYLGEQPVWTTAFADALGRNTKVRTPDNAIARTTYSGNAVTVSDQTGKARKNVSDALGRLTSVYEDPNGLNYPTSYSYDVLDDLMSVSQEVQTRTFVYDSFKRLTSATNPESGVLSYTYDNNGNLRTKTDARGIVTTIAYDALNRPTSKSYQNDGGITPAVAYFYDSQALPAGAPTFDRGYANGRLVAVTYGGGSAGDYYGFDALGRTLGKVQQTGGVNYLTSASYNVSGGVTSETYPSNHSVNYGFDSAGRLNSFSGYLGDSGLRTYSTGISYSAFGGMSQEQFGTTTLLYNKLFYNVRGQLAEIREGVTPNDTGWERGAILNVYSASPADGWTASGADNNGNLRKEMIFIPGSSFQPTLFYDYDALNRIYQAREVNGGQNSWVQYFDYDPYGNRTINQGNTWGGVNNIQFDKNEAASTNRLYAPGDTSLPMNQRQIQYDAAGNQSYDGYTGQGARSYDAENRLKQAWASGQWQTYSYDGEGKRVKRNVSGAETWQVFGLGGELIAEYAATNSNPLSPQKEYGYRNGQLLITATVAAGSGGSAFTFTDNPLVAGVTIVKAVHLTELRTAVNQARAHAGLSAATWTDDPAQATVTAIRAVHLTELRARLDEARAALGLSVASYTDPTLTAGSTTVRAVHIQELRTKTNEALTGGGSGAVDVRWLVADQLGTPRMIFDQSGSLANTSRHDYLPFGEELGSLTGRTPDKGYTNSDAARQRFTGQQRDNETGLDYFNARYYSSNGGRFTSPDPFGGSMSTASPQSFNRYSYVVNNPVNMSDPTGLSGDGPGGSLPGAEGALGRLTGNNGVFETDWSGNATQLWMMSYGESEAEPAELSNEEVGQPQEKAKPESPQNPSQTPQIIPCVAQLPTDTEQLALVYSIMHEGTPEGNIGKQEYWSDGTRSGATINADSLQLEARFLASAIKNYAIANNKSIYDAAHDDHYMIDATHKSQYFWDLGARLTNNAAASSLSPDCNKLKRAITAATTERAQSGLPPNIQHWRGVLQKGGPRPFTPGVTIRMADTDFIP